MSFTPPLGPRRLVRESVPIAITLSVWQVAALVLSRSGTDDALRLAGLAMAGLYALVRGVTLCAHLDVDATPRALADVLRENGWVLVGAGGWFLLVQALGWGLRVAPWIDWVRELVVVDLAAFVLNWTGVGAVVLYAVAVGSARVRADPATTD